MGIWESEKEQILQNDPSLAHLDLSNRGLNDNAIGELVELMQNNNIITSLDLSHNNITSESCQLLKLRTSLRELNISSTHIRDKGLKVLLTMNLKSLNVSECGITDVGAEELLNQLDKFEYVEVYGNPSISKDLVWKIRKRFHPTLPEPTSEDEPDLADLLGIGFNFRAPSVNSSPK